MMNFNGKPSMVITTIELQMIMKTIGIHFCGCENVSTTERDTFEEKTDMAFEPLYDGKVKIHNLNFQWED